MERLNDTLMHITPCYEDMMEKAWQHMDSLLKPVRSLGRLEEIGVQMAGITGKLHNTINKKNIIVMCADNGVCDEGVSGCSQEITMTLTNRFPEYDTGVGVLAKFSGADITTVDIGTKGEITNNKVLNYRVKNGTNNMCKGPAMTRQEAVKAIEVGIEITEKLITQGYNLFGTGEMGIGNTSTSAAVIATLLDIPVEPIVGLGAGLSENQYRNKKNKIKEAIAINQPNSDDPIDVLQKVGGLDIAGICGCYLAAARQRVPIVIDGVISAAAALCAYKLNPLVRSYMFPSHQSVEVAMAKVYKHMDLEPMFNLNMRLGEGSGCPLAFQVIESALYMTTHMATFVESGVGDDEIENYESLYSEREKMKHK